MALKGTTTEAIKIQGLGSLVKMLDNIGGAPLTKQLKVAGKEAAKPVMEDAKAEAPVRSGRLKDSIRLASLKKSVQVRAGSKRIPYANPIHWGWFYDKNNFIYKNIKPNPFMSRALGYNKAQITKTYLENVDELLKNECDAQKLKLKAGI